MIKVFIRNTTLFLLPIVIIGLSLEVSVRNTDNTFISKASFIHENKDIELLILGSSHNQGIYAEEFTMKAANLAYGMQDIQLDSALYFSQIQELSNLKCIILEYDYLTLFKKNQNSYFRYGWYYIYYGIDLTDLKGIQRYSLYSTSPEFFNNHLKQTFKGNGQKGEVSTFERFGFDENKIQKEGKARMEKVKKVLNKEDFEFNAAKLTSVIEHCQKNKVKVILLSNPMYETYVDGYEHDLVQIRNSFLQQLLSNYSNTIHLDFETDHKFKVTDFTNEDHLTQKAAKDYTHLLNMKIDSIYNSPSLY